MAKKQFKAESKRLLDLMINSIYTHKEIFLREIISNASDACDKLCYQALTDDSVGMSRKDFKIEIKVDKEQRILTVSDNGIGMDREDLENNLGVIASSGSYRFKQEVGDDAKDTDVIGQFGVGFYSAFMVADHITVVTKKYGADTAWMWQSSGADGYTITACERDSVGTDIIMHIKPDTDDEKYSEFLESWRLQELVRKYSDYIRFPIRMEVSKTRRKEGSPDDKPEYETYQEEETLNSMVPIWQRRKSSVKPEEYNKFYRDKFHDYADPQKVIAVSAEGAVTYKALLFIPGATPFDYYTKEYEKGLQLYSNGVLIMDKCADLLPEHFRFVRGVVDSPDLSLNISRELLQHDRQLKVIAANLEKKIKSELAKMLKDDREGYEKFWKNFGRQLKYGVVAEYGAHKDLLQDLLLFYSSTEKKPVTLAEYVSRMKEDQKYHLLRRRRQPGQDRQAAPDRGPAGVRHGDPLLHRGGGRVLRPDPPHLSGQGVPLRPGPGDRGGCREEGRGGRRRPQGCLRLREGDPGGPGEGGQGQRPPEVPPRVPDGRGGPELRDGEVLPGGPAGQRHPRRAHFGAECGPPRLPGPGGRRDGGPGEGQKVRHAAVRPGPADRGPAPGGSLRLHRPGV